MKAIVLTFDKYIKFAEHMVLAYQKKWPSHPFTFRIPYGDDQCLPDFSKYGKKVELIQTDAAKPIYSLVSESGTKQVSLIRATVLKLLENIPDDEWIYWCMDDRYPIRIKEKKANDICQFIQNIDDEQVIQVNFIRSSTGGYWKSDKFLKEDGDLYTPNNQVFRETVFTETSQIKSIWMHQFFRTKALRRLFSSFPDRPFVGKELDSFTHSKLPGEKCYVIAQNIGVYGESNSRGEITENCAASFQKLGLKLPNNMQISTKYFVTGELPYEFFGLEFNLPKRLDRFLVSVNRWKDRQLM